MVGKLNYYLGKKAFDEGRSSARYKEVDFCKDPSAICRGHYEDNEMNAEIRWLMGMLYWINKVQSYKQNGWNYLVNLHNFVDGGMVDTDFMDDVSRIVTRGCHDEGGCGHPVSSVERKERFDKVMDYFKKAQLGSSSVEEDTALLTLNPTGMPSKKLTLAPVEQTNQPSLSRTGDPTTSTRKTVSPSTSPITRSPVGVESSSPVPSVASGEAEEEYALTPAELASVGVGQSVEESPSEEIVVTEPPPESDSFSGSVSCNGMCLRPLSSNECLAGGEALVSLPDCLDISIGGMCEDVGSGCIIDGVDTTYASNCPGGRHVFMRVFDDKCGGTSTNSPSSPTPTVFAPPSIKPSLSASHENSNATYIDHNSVTNETESKDGFSSFLDDRPGAWWTWNETNIGSRRHSFSFGISYLLITVIFILCI